MTDYVKLTTALLNRAFPTGISESEYFAVLLILNPHMSHRNLAEVIYIFTGRDYARVYNDVMGIDGMYLDEGLVARVQQLIDDAGFEQWLRDA